ncbi:hypothetical protein [Gryllotalpicola protaetiae]|uniref:DUF8094 domain-containing protein n=1 Tax=Gryllotalpicola protaetiae TaxID=2419771 RepID=A0A387BM53_9MICO|nr:hypothetical protein [Gryllotalpicola protaetiae]AYG02116.1 hypothetical protein D7I44_00275 [Gryllotalpicola protaetiae]
MRFVIAIAAFLAAAIMIGVGIAQRTIWAPAASATATAEVRQGAPYIVISGSTLNAREGQQTLKVAGSSAPFVAYGRTADVLAWVGKEPYTRISYNAQTESLTSTLVRDGKSGTGGTSDATPSPTATPTAGGTPTAGASEKASARTPASLDPKAPNPDGSDLWLDQFTGVKAATTTMNVPDGVSVIIASDGAHAAPDSVSLTWPMDTRTPWAGPLISLGGLVAAAGVVFYILALRHLRRGRGPRRGGSNGRPPRLPRPPRARRVREVGPAPVETHGRRSLGRGLIAVPVVLAGALTLAGCSSDYWPAVGQSETPVATTTPLATQLPGQGKDHPAPAVTEPQLRNIVARIATTAKTADASMDATLAATRFTGAALTERQVNYQIRHAKPGYAAPAAIPQNPKLSIVLPQATATWPRVVNVIVEDTTNKSAAPLDLTLTQATPRDNYKVAYSVTMLGGAKIPDLAPANIGATSVPPDSKLLSVPPSKLAQDYASILALGKNSDSDKLFDLAHDSLAKQVGAEFKAQTIQQMIDKKSAATLTYADQAGTNAPIALATNNAGALVVANVLETQTIKPTDPAAEITLSEPDGPTAALTGLTKTSKGLETDYGYQLLFYVPPAESKEQIRLLGFAQAVIGAKELP